VPAPPLAGHVLAAAQSGGDRLVAQAVRGQQHDPRPEHPPERRRAALGNGFKLRLFRLRYADSASAWGLAIYRASQEDYEKSILPSGWPAGTPQEALDCACGLYLDDHTAWLTPDE
jgi:hypothetical protein